MKKMQMIILNGKPTSIEEFLDLFRDGNDYDFDAIGSLLDSDALDAAMNSFTESYDMFELIERYLQFADKPIEFNFPVPKVRWD